MSRTLGVVHGVYYLATGVWPLLHMRSFEAVTGPKHDRWLVHTVGAVVGAFGAALLGSAARRPPSRDLQVAATSLAASLAAIDVVYVARRRISPIYLADAVLEIGLAAAWSRELSLAARTDAAAAPAPARPARQARRASPGGDGSPRAARRAGRLPAPSR